MHDNFFYYLFKLVFDKVKKKINAAPLTWDSRINIG